MKLFVRNLVITLSLWFMIDIRIAVAENGGYENWHATWIILLTAAFLVALDWRVNDKP